MKMAAMNTIRESGSVTLPIYMDNHATTPVDPRVLESMLPYYTRAFGNSASRTHSFGWVAEEAVEKARAQVAALIGESPKEIVFTSGATESNNLAIKGVAERRRHQGNHIITAATEHKSVLDTCKYLEASGCHITYLPVGPDGLIDPELLESSIVPETVLVTIMLANNEIGVLQPVAEIGKICREKGVLFHCDAVQAVGKVPVSAIANQVDLMSITAHKLYGPKGVGALYIGSGNGDLGCAAQIHGGGHERGFRSGTLNVPGIVGMGRACEIAKAEMPEESKRLTLFRDRLKSGLQSRLQDVRINGTMEHRLPGNLNVAFPKVDSESLLLEVTDIALSRGSACSEGQPSYVLRALGLSREEANGSVRFGIGRFNTEAEIDYAIERLATSIERHRGWRRAFFGFAAGRL